MRQCKSAKAYKGMFYPTCNNGEPCEYCIALYSYYHNDGTGRKTKKPKLENSK